MTVTRRIRVATAVALGAVLCLAMAGAAVAQDVPRIHDASPTTLAGVQHEVLTEDVMDPTAIEVAADGRVVIAERTGRIKVWHQDGQLVEAGRIPVSASNCYDCTDGRPEEGGLHGLLLDPDFTENGRFLAYRSVPHSVDPDTHEGVFRLSWFRIGDDGKLARDGTQLAEEPVLDVPAYWPESAHNAGDLEWLADGTILIAVGDDTVPFHSGGFSPHDQREDYEWNDATRTAQNSADRRGKILRVNPDGTEPEDNPHVGDEDYDPYVYAMGFRNPYRITVHEASQTVFVGNVGPDAWSADNNRGPAGMDEVEAVPQGGGTNHGWPFCIGDNEPYRQYDWDTGQVGDWFDCTDMTPAVIAYPYPPTFDYPLLAAGLRATMAGPVYDYDGEGALRLPAAFQGRLVLSDWARGLLFTIPIDADGSASTSELDVMPFYAGPAQSALRSVIDMEVGPDGALYLAEYGGPGFWNNSNSRISRMKCLGCTPQSSDYEGEPAVSGTVIDGIPLPAATARAGLDHRAVALLAAVLIGLGVPLRRRVT